MDYDEMNEVVETEEFEGGKDYSTAIGAGAIAVGGVLVYEGVRHGVKYAKRGLGWIKGKWDASHKKAVEEAEAAEEVSETEAEVK